MVALAAQEFRVAAVGRVRASDLGAVQQVRAVRAQVEPALQVRVQEQDPVVAVRPVRVERAPQADSAVPGCPVIPASGALVARELE